MDYIKKRDEELGPYATNYSDLVKIAPTTYGLVAADSTALEAAVTLFTTALETATNPSTRTPVAIVAKDTAKAQLIELLRTLTAKIQACTTVTAAQKAALGITVHDRVPSPVPPPATKPLLAVTGKGERTIELRMVNEATPLRRARPEEAAGAEVYSFVAAAGQTPPADLKAWNYEGQVTKNEFVLAYPAEDTGKTLHVRAMWYNRKGERGPASDPLITSIAA